jgi:S1-C subfamily serine protease
MPDAMKFALVLLVAFILNCFNAWVFGAPPVRAVPQPQCVRVFVKDKEGMSAGSGALIDSDLIVTCNHVVKDRKTDDVEVMFPSWEVIPGKVWKTDKKLDVALIKLLRDAECQPLSLNLEVPSKLSIQGYGYGTYRQRWGKVSADIYAPGQGQKGVWREILVATARSGDSGGPVIDAEGRYCGTLWGAGGDGTMFTPLEHIFPMLSIPKPEPETTPLLFSPLYPVLPIGGER